jgi:hypothetical protein
MGNILNMFKKTVRTVKLSEIKPTTNRIVWGNRHKGLRDSIIDNYNIKNGIVISKNMKIVDGHHRYTIFREIYSPDFEIEVRQIPFDFIWITICNWAFLPVMLFSICIFLPIIMVFKIIKKLI